ncbi:SLAP domain-containing protein [Lactobacillus sp. ESL0731]|uniref:SLAP domain-containing protein n=1 Tax=unclassified Lactobacillus TaxID=2620435 RepID=UPI0023F7DC66|nr:MULTISPECIES: SLAP domain-containing protein [unclassified Lactobacillus]WEV51902.1 SLAP domain-containing protein [Lactobacillus sp. ESL0700]WEV63033.1 SLAP domain-containing protein [Lactobacillus sp. ESL0731]
MEMQAKHDRFSIRKLSIGAASVLLGFTFFGMGSQSVQADTVTPETQSTSVDTEANNESVDTAKKAVTSSKDSNKPQVKKNNKKEQKLDTYAKLSKFLRDDSATVAANDGDNAASSKPTAAKPDQKPADTASQTPAEKPNQSANNTNSGSDITGNNSKPANTNQAGEDKVPEDANITSSTAKPGQKPVDSDPAASAAAGVAVTNGEKPTAPDQDDKKKPAAQGDKGKTSDGLSLSTTHDSTVYISSWSDLMEVFRNTNITTAYLTQSIADDDYDGVWGNDGWGSGSAHSSAGDRFIASRKGGLTIASDPAKKQRFTIDFKGLQPKPEPASKFTGQFSRGHGNGDNGTNDRMFLTYDNLDLWSETYYGLAETEELATTLVFNDVSFHGTQMLFTGNNTEIHFRGTDTAEVIRTPYIGPVDHDDAEQTGNATTQQLLQFTGTGTKLYFDEGCNFTGSTYQGNVIEISGNNSIVSIAKDAVVTLNPTGTADANASANGAENTNKPSGIVVTGGGKNVITVAQGGKLIINVGGQDAATRNAYNGKLDYHQAAAILLESSGSEIDNDGIIEINTNGDISKDDEAQTNVLLYDNGNLNVGSGGELNIIGSNMQNYSGTLVQIRGNADLENSKFSIKLTGTDGQTTAVPGATSGGTGKVTLIDVNGKLTINNPKSLEIDAHLNSNPNSSIIGDNKVTITNVKQVLDLNGQKIALPPFHKLVVHHASGPNRILVDQIELLNGKRKLDAKQLAKLQADPNLAAVIGSFPNLGTQLQSFIGKTFDEIFANVIMAALKDPNSPGFNNIAFIPANDEGFLNIANATVTEKEDDDGSRIISGHLNNYSQDKDGPGSDGIFNVLLPGGTNAYIIATIEDKGNTNYDGHTWSNPELAASTDPADDPYSDTDLFTINSSGKGTYPTNQTSDSTLPRKVKFAAKVDENGDFSFTLPPEYVAMLKKGAKVRLTPTANFVGYQNSQQEPSLDLNIKNTEDYQSEYANKIKTTAGNAIDAVKQAAAADPDQTPEHQKKYQDYIAEINDAQDKALNQSPTADDTDSIYNPNNKLPDIQKRRDAALNKINTATNKAQAYSDVQQYLAAANKDLNNAGIDTADFAGQGSGFSDTDIDNALSAMAADGSNKTDLETPLKQKIFDKYKTSLSAAITDYDGTKGKELAGLTLPAGTHYQSDIDSSKSNIANDLAYKGDGTEFTGSANVTAAKTAIDLSVAKANAASEVQKYATSMAAAYPNSANAINQANADHQKIIENETSLANLQDSTPANANANNHDQVKDVKDGIAAIDVAIKNYKQGLKDHLNNQINGGKDADGTAHDSLNSAVENLQNSLNDAGFGNDPDIIKGINKLKDELKQAGNIAKDGGDIDAADSDQAAADKNKEAQDLIDDVNKRLDALNQLKDAADKAKKDHPKQSAAINDAWKEAAKNVLNAAKDTGKNTPIEDAGKNGVAAITNTGLQSHAKDDIDTAYNAAKKRIQNSGLSAKDQAKYLADLDAAYKLATDKTGKDSIYTTNSSDYIKNRKQRALNKFNKAAAKAEVAGYADKVKNELGIAGNNAAIDAALAAGEGLIDGISEGGATAPDNSQLIADNEQTAKDKILAAAKTAAKDLLAQKEKDIDDALAKLPNLSGDDLAAAKQKAKDYVTAAGKDIDAATDDTGVKTAYDNGVLNLNNLLQTETKKDNRKQAIKDIENKRDEVLADLNDKNKYPDLTDEHRKQLIDNANNAAKDGIDALNSPSAVPDDQVEGEKNKTLTNLDNVLTNAASENKTDKENKENEVNTAKTAALNKLKAAHDAAVSKVNGYKDNQISSTDKANYLAQIEHDYSAAQNAINGATDVDRVNAAEAKGEKDFDKQTDLAEIEAAKSDAIAELDKDRDAALTAVENAHNSGSITDDQYNKMKDDITSFHNDGASAINQDKDKAAITQDKNTAAEKIKGVVDGISDTALANSKEKAKTDLETAAKDAKDHIDGLDSLGQDEKNSLKQQIDDQLKAAETAVDTAKTPDAAASAGRNGKTDFANTSADADLKNAKIKGKHKLDDQLKAVDDAIDALTNLDQASKDALKQSVKNAYNDALNKVNNPDPATPSQVATNAKDGYDAMQDIINKAQSLDTVKQTNKNKLDQAAQDAKDRIDKSALTDKQKQDAYQAIDKARDNAKANVDKATDTSGVTQAENDGEKAITDAEAAANKDYLDGLKDQAKHDIDEACNDAETALDDEWKTLTSDEQDKVKDDFNKAKQSIEDARKAAKDKVDKATNKDDIDGAVTEATNSAAAAKKPALLAASKEKAKQEIKDYGDKIKGQLTNQSDKDIVDSLVNDAIQEIDKDASADEVNGTVTKYKDKIDGVKTAADSAEADAIKKAREEALAALNHKLNGDGKDKGVLDQIDALKDHLTQDQLDKYKNEATGAHKTYTGNVNGDTNVSDINSDKKHGLDAMQAALDEATLQAAKNDANKKLQQDAQDAIDKINGMTNLTDDQKKDAINKVNNAISPDPEGGQYQVNNAKDKDSIDKILSDTENTINNIVGNSSNTSFTAAQNKAKGDLETKAKKLKQKIKDDLAAGKLSETQANGPDGKGGLNAAIDDALSAAEGKIDAATDQAGIDQAEKDGNTALDNINDEINKDEAYNADLKKVADAVKAAKDQAKKYFDSHPHMTQAQKDKVNNSVDAIGNAANESIKQHYNDPENAINNMDQAAHDAVDKLSHLTSGWDDKEQAVEKLKAHAKQDSDNVTANNPDFDQLTPAEIAAAQQAIQQAQLDGENTIFGLDTSKNNLNDTEKNCEKDVDNALLPYKLLNKQHHQTSALDDYAAGKDGQSGDGAIDALPNLTDKEKEDYKAQIAKARQDAANKVNGIKLPDKPTDADYNSAAKDVDDAEKAGEAAIAAIINQAKQNDDKRQADKELEDAANKAKTDNPDLADAINQVVSDAEKQIENTSVTDPTNAKSPEGIKNDAIDKINKLVDDAKIGSHKQDTIKKLDQEKSKAAAVINRSQLTDEQKKAALAKLDALYDDAQKRLDTSKTDKNGKPLPANVYQAAADQIANDYQKMIDMVINQNSKNADYPWFENEADNAHGDLNGKWNNLEGSLSDTQKNKYRDLINTIENSIGDLDKSQSGHKTSISDDITAYDAGLTALNKLKAVKDVEDAQTAANTAIDGHSNLSKEQKQSYKDQADKDAQTAINNILGVNPSANDTIGNQDKIDAAKGSVDKDLATIVNNANKDDAGVLADAKKKAAAKIDDAYNAAKKKLGSAYKPGGELDQAHQHEIDQLNGMSLDALQNVDDAIKNVDKAAVNEAGDYAKDQIDKLPDFTDHQKQALKGQIDKDVAVANGDQGTITAGTVDPDTVTTARDNTIDTILADAKGDTQNDKDALANDPAVQLDEAKAQAEKDIQTVYDAAKAKLPSGADTSELDDAFNNNKNVNGSSIQEIKDAVKAAEQAIAKGAIKDAAKAAKNQITGLKHDDGTDFTDAEKNALNNLIDSDVAKADDAINAAAADQTGITLADATNSTDEGIVSGALNNHLMTIAADGSGTSDADKDALNTDPTVLADAKQKAKDAVNTAANKAKKAVDKLTNHKDGTPYTAAEKQALKDAIQKEVDKANDDSTGSIDQADTVGKVDQAKDDALAAINGIKDDCDKNKEDALNNIINNDPNVEKERQDKENAKKAVQEAANKARQDLGVTEGSSDAAKIDQAEEDALAKINEVTDGNYTTAANTGLGNIVDQEKQTAKDKLGKDADVSAIDAVTSDDTTSANVTDKQDAIKNAFNSSKDKQAALTAANSAIDAAYHTAIDKLHEQYGPNADTSKTDAAYKDHHVAQGDTVDAIKADALKAEKEIAQGEIADAAANAKNKIDHLANKPDGTPYTDTEKQALKDKIDQEIDDYVSQGNQAITDSDTEDKVNSARDKALDNINNALSADNLADILSKDPNVAKDNANAAIDQAAQDAIDKIDKNKTWSKEQKDKLKDRVKQDAQVGKDKIKNDSDIAAINKDKDAAIDKINNELTAGTAMQAAKDKIQQAHDAAIANGVSKEDADKAQEEANEAIENAKDPSDIDQAQLAGEKDFAKLEVAHAHDVAIANGVSKDDADKAQVAANAAIDKADSESGVDDSKLDGEKDLAKLEVSHAYDAAIASGVSKDDADKAQAAANAAIDKADSQAGINSNKLNGEKDLAKLEVSHAYDAAIASGVSKEDANKAREDANNAIDKADSQTGINKNKLDGEKDLAKLEVSHAYDAAIASGVSKDDANKAREDANNAIDKADNQAGINKNKLSGEKDLAKLEVAHSHDLAIANGVSEADADKAQAAANAAIDKADNQSGINNSKLDGEKDLAKLEVQAAYDTAISSHLTDERAEQAKKDRDTALAAIDDAKDSAGITNGKLSGEKDIAKLEVDQSYDDAIASGVSKDKADKAKQDALGNINDGKNNNTVTKDKLGGEKDLAKLEVSNAADKAKQQVKDQTKGLPQDLINELLREFDDYLNEANGDDTNNGTIDDANNRPSITDARDKAIKKINDALEKIKQKYQNTSSSPSEPVQQPAPAKEEKGTDLILMHNAYLYDENGNRANKINLKAGSVVTTYGKQKINGTEYFILIDKGANNKKYYLVSTNITSVHKTLTHNAYVYNKYGQRIKSRHALKKGTTIATFGSAVTIEGRKYYITGENKYVRVTNFASDSTAATKTVKTQEAVAPISDKPDAPVEKKIMHNAYLYNKQGVRTTGLIFNAGSVITTTGTKSIDGEIYYGLEDGLYVKAANIDAKKLKLKHNAYIYGQYGNRKGKKVLKKSKSVKTYGNAISVQGKKYYITAKGKLVKKANFNKK